MNRTLGTLLAVLLIQCGLVGVVYWPAPLSDELSLEPMIPFSRELIDEIYVGDEFDNETMLLQVGQRWWLPELENLPADNAMVERLLEAITADNKGWPTADSVAARQRFQVASYHYQRRVRLFREYDLLGTVLLGTSPGFRKVHARNESQDAIYSIPFSTHDAPGNSGAWLDRKLLQIRAPLRISADSYSLERQDNAWVSGIGRAPDERELQALLSALRSLQIEGLAAEDSQRDLAEAEADLVLVVASLAGEVTLELWQMNDQHFIKSSEYPLFFTISGYDYDRLASIDFRLISGEEQSN